MIGQRHAPSGRRTWPLALGKLACLLGVGLSATCLAADPVQADTLGKPRNASTRLVAAPMADPTRPPGYVPMASGASGAGRGAAGMDVKGFLEPPPPPPAVLQSVQVPVHGAATAVVDGRLVRAGDAVDGSTVLSIDAQGLVLRTTRGEERKWLLGGSAKQAPGSIVVQRTASFVPAEANAAPEPERADALRATPTTAKATPVRIPSLAGSNRP